jgi:transcriptional regulator with XRE-family HTH domain
MARVTYETALVEEKAVAHVQAMALRLLRAKNMSQKDLAREMEVSPAHISQLLGDEPKNLSVRKAARMFYHLGETLEMTCGGIERLNADAEERNAQKAAAFKKSSDTFAWCHSANGNEEDCCGTGPAREQVAA